jgi:hypothetical protein
MPIRWSTGRSARQRQRAESVIGLVLLFASAFDIALPVGFVASLITGLWLVARGRVAAPPQRA